MQLVWMLVPVLLFFIIFSYIPMCGLIIAFKDYRMDLGIIHSPWAGLANLSELLQAFEFRKALTNTIIISMLRLSFGFVAPVLLALLLNEIRVTWYKRTIQTIVYLPYFFSWVLLGGIILTVFSSNGPMNLVYMLLLDICNFCLGQINSLFGTNLHHFAFSPIQFMTNRHWFLFVLILTGIWQEVGYSAIIYLAALAGIPVELYESANVDGAGRWHQTIHITLPVLMPTIVTLFLLRLGQILNAGFDQIYNLYNPIVYDSADIIDTYVLRILQNMDFSLATAAGMFKSIIGMILIVTVNMIVNKYTKGEKGLW